MATANNGNNNTHNEVGTSNIVKEDSASNVKETKIIRLQNGMKSNYVILPVCKYQGTVFSCPSYLIVDRYHIVCTRDHDKKIIQISLNNIVCSLCILFLLVLLQPSNFVHARATVFNSNTIAGAFPICWNNIDEHNCTYTHLLNQTGVLPVESLQSYIYLTTPILGTIIETIDEINI